LRERYTVGIESGEPVKTVTGPDFLTWANGEFQQANPFEDDKLFTKARASDDVFTITADANDRAPLSESGSYILRRPISFSDFPKPPSGTS
jgi:hypothetical protein